MARYQPEHPPSHCGGFDLTGHIGPLPGFEELVANPQWPMYSYDRPATMLWQAVGERLHKAGWPDDKIRKWLASKNPRYALDGALGDAIEKLGTDYAERILGEPL